MCICDAAGSGDSVGCCKRDELISERVSVNPRMRGSAWFVIKRPPSNGGSRGGALRRLCASTTRRWWWAPITRTVGLAGSDMTVSGIDTGVEQGPAGQDGGRPDADAERLGFTGTVNLPPRAA